MAAVTLFCAHGLFMDRGESKQIEASVEGGVFDVIAVSYTHLDVYKRQG